MRCPFVAYRWMTTSATQRARAASSRAVAFSRETASAVALARAYHTKAGCVSEPAAGTSRKGLAPKERGLSPMRCRFIAQGRITTSAARRVRMSSLRAVPSPGRQPAQWRSRVCYTKAGWHLAPRCCTERERAPASAVSYHRTWAVTISVARRMRTASSCASRSSQS